MNPDLSHETTLKDEKLVILINGWIKSGKDTCADYLINTFPDEYITKISIASALKDFVASKYNIPRELLNTQEGKKGYRHLLIEEAEEAKKKDINIWVKHTLGEIAKCNTPLIVIPDLRFINEYQEIKKHYKVITLRINRFDTPIYEDPSEHQLDDFTFDYVIENKGSVANFIDKIQIFINMIKIDYKFIKSPIK